jgi:hypothetical protein
MEQWTANNPRKKRSSAMSKVLSSLIAVMLVSSVALADVSQTESYLAALGNGVNLVQCQTSADSTNNLIIDNKQDAIGGCQTTGNQFQMGIFRQAASAEGVCATIGIPQNVASTGTQLQLIGDGVGSRAQQENLGLIAGQTITKINGQGEGTASQFVALSGGQTGANCIGPVGQSSALVSCQDAFVTGIPTAQSMAGATTQGTTAQAQLVN